MSALAQISAVLIDCADPAKLAGFYREVTGREVTYSDDDYVSLDGGPVLLGFQRIEGYRAAGWPDPAKHIHLDLKVTDLAAATERLVAIGATVPEFQPGEGKWVVLADPEGHVFCLVT
jgi:predicted enzyme related to lactoylglutathione lyase